MGQRRLAGERSGRVRQHVLTFVRFIVTLRRWTSRRAPASTVSPTTTCSTLFDITGEPSRPTMTRHDVHRSVDERRSVGGRRRHRRRWNSGDTRDAGSAEVPETIGEAMSSTREQRATNLERWADDVDSDDFAKSTPMRCARSSTSSINAATSRTSSTRLFQLLASPIDRGQRSARCSALASRPPSESMATGPSVSRRYRT